MVNFIERLKVCWHVLTKRNYVYFGLGNDAFVFDDNGNYVNTKLNKINTDYGLISLKDFMWSAISDYANQQVHNSCLKGHRGDEEY